MISITMPKSDLVTADHPYAVVLELDPGLDASEAVVTARLRHAERSATDAEITAQATVPLPAPDAQGGGRRVRVLLNAGRLAEGDYAGELLVQVGDEQVNQPICLFRMPAERPEEFPFGIYAVPFPEGDEDGRRLMLEEVRDSGVNVICQHMNMIGELGPILDQAARLGIRFMPSTNLRLKGKDVPEESRDRLSHPGPEEARRICFASPHVREQGRHDLAERLHDYQAHPGFSGLVYYGDDLFMRTACNLGTMAISCYCETCRRGFAERAGIAPPTTTEATEGLVPSDHPWLQWMRYRCGEVYGGFVRELEEVRRAEAPQARMGLCHGAPFAPFTQVACGIYGPLTQPTAVVSSYGYPYLRSPRVDLIGHYELGRMGNRDKDVWMLGAINSNWTNYPAWQVYQNFWNMLAAGYRFIALFAWHDFVTGAREGYVEEAEACKRALGVVGARKNWLLPVAAHWSPVDSPFAALYSFTTESFDIQPRNRGHLHTERVLDFYRMALRRQVPMDVICEEEVLSGLLDRYEAICLHDVRTLPEDVHARLQDYIAGGGTVFIDNDILMYYDENHPAVRPEGTIGCSPETAVAMLRDRRPPEVTVSSGHVTVRRLRSGGLDYAVLVNNFADQYWGFQFHYWVKRIHENYEHVKFVRDEAVQTELHFGGPKRWLADLETGEVLATASPLALELAPSWGMALVALPSPEARPSVEGAEAARQGETARWQLEVVGKAGKRIDGAFAVRVEVQTPSGRRSRYSCFLSVEGGAGEFALPLGANDETGAWRVAFEGGFPRKTVEVVLQVTAGEPPANLLSWAEADV